MRRRFICVSLVAARTRSGENSGAGAARQRCESAHTPLSVRCPQACARVAAVRRLAPIKVFTIKGLQMSGSFDDRRKGFESKWAHDADMQFKIMARRNKLLGLWAAGEMGLSAEKADAYAKAVVAADFEE